MQIDGCRQARRMKSQVEQELKLNTFLMLNSEVVTPEQRGKGNLTQQWKAEITCLQETKLEGNVQALVKQIWGGRWIRSTTGKQAELEVRS